MKKIKIILLFTFSLLLTLFFSIYQRVTGPTHPFKVNLKILEKNYSFKLPRSGIVGKNLEIKIQIGEKSVWGELFYKNISEGKDWQVLVFDRQKEFLYASLNPLPPAGKYIYYIKLHMLGREIQIPEKPISIRFKGKVPDFILILHILFIFSGFLISIYTGLYSMVFGLSKKLTLTTLILFLIGAGILGPIVQYYAFGDFWTGFPLGNDLTDNKGLILIIFWGLAYFQIERGKGKEWVLLAFFVSVLVFFIPHSMWGSELRGGKIKTGP